MKKQVKKEISILSDTFNSVGRDWTSFLAISFIAAVIWKLWRIYAVPQFAGMLGINLSTPYLPENIPQIPLTVLLLLTLIFAFMLAGIIQTAIILLLDKPGLKIGDLFRKTGEKFIPVATVMLLTQLLLITGTLLLIIPLFIFAFFVQFAVYITVLDNKTGITALLKSAVLVKNNFLFVIVRVLFIWVIAIIIHLLTRKLLFTSIAYHTIIVPFIITYHYHLYRILKK